MDVIKIQFKKQVKGVDAGEVELTWISPLKTKQYFIMDDYKYVIVVENIEVVVINVNNPDDYADEVLKLYMKADINHKTIEDEDIPQRLNAQQIDNIIFNIDLLKIFT